MSSAGVRATMWIVALIAPMATNFLLIAVAAFGAISAVLVLFWPTGMLT